MHSIYPAPTVIDATDNEYFRLMIDAAPTGFVLIDGAGMIVLVNRHLTTLFGYDEAELLGQPIETLLPQRVRATHPERVRSFFINPSVRPMGAGRDLYAARKDGTEFPVEVGLTPLSSTKGMLVLATIVDISERKNAQKQLARNRDLFNAVVEAAPTGIVMIDMNGRITLVNCQLEAQFGYSREDLIGQPIEVLMPARLRQSHPEHVRKFFTDPTTRAMGAGRDLYAARQNGTEFPVEIGLSPVHLADGRQVLATIADITERKKDETKLRRANDGLEEFVYVASHDLRSPLRGIADLIEWVKEDLEATPNPKVSHNLDRVAIRIERLERLITDLLAYARAGSSQSETLAFDVRDLVERVLELQPPRAGFEVTLQVPELHMIAARTPLETVLRNLVSNAIKHHDKDVGTVMIQARSKGEFIEFAVSDDGPGIPTRSQDRVFKLFQTASTAERRSSGVGLAISKRMVEAHGGWIVVESRDGERGTTFRFFWPATATSPSTGNAR
ncbi:MAG: PAS domain S-box protein [Zoogloea sp.]|nr:PAS domain S-box protein [Zoogloea sp.]